MQMRLGPRRCLTWQMQAKDRQKYEVIVSMISLILIFNIGWNFPFVHHGSTFLAIVTPSLNKVDHRDTRVGHVAKIQEETVYVA